MLRGGLRTLTVAFGLFIAFDALWPVFAEAQVDCQPAQFVDRTDVGASRQLAWDFGITSNPARCMKVAVGQTVVWNGDLDVHPLGAAGGNTPNPIATNANGRVTFSTPGTYGYVCLAHSSMKGAIMVVAAQSASVPALAGYAKPALALVLLAIGLLTFRTKVDPRRKRRTASS